MVADGAGDSAEAGNQDFLGGKLQPHCKASWLLVNSGIKYGGKMAKGIFLDWKINNVILCDICSQFCFAHKTFVPFLATTVLLGNQTSITFSSIGEFKFLVLQWVSMGFSF